jgi:hypothetical protein
MSSVPYSKYAPEFEKLGFQVSIVEKNEKKHCLVEVGITQLLMIETDQSDEDTIPQREYDAVVRKGAR